MVFDAKYQKAPQRRINDSAGRGLGGMIACHDPHLDMKEPGNRWEEEGIVGQGVDGEAEDEQHPVPI
jgi:hypothetical protein